MAIKGDMNVDFKDAQNEHVDFNDGKKNDYCENNQSQAIGVFGQPKARAHTLSPSTP